MDPAEAGSCIQGDSVQGIICAGRAVWQGLQESVPLSGSMEDHLQGHDSSSQAEQLLGAGIPLRGKKKPSYRGAGNAPCISFRI